MEKDEANNKSNPDETILPNGVKIRMITPEEARGNKVESFEGRILHPSLDILGDILVLGFRYRVSLKEYQNIFLIMGKNSLHITEATTIDAGDSGGKYFLEIKDRKLMRVEDRWGLEAMKNFVDDFLSVKEGIVPKPKEIAEKIVELSKKYIELEKDIDYLLLSAWILGTYFFPIFYAYPFLSIKAPKGSGKSQCLNFLRQICFNAIKSRPTLAALGDTVDALRGTYLIDQADSLERKGGEELLDILADSYKKGGGKRRIMNLNKGSREILEFDTYSPKAFASIKELPEDLRDRCLVIPLVRSQKNFHDPDDEDTNWKETRGMIYKFLVDNFTIVASLYEVGKVSYRENRETVGRELELWLPLEVIFKMLGWDEKIEEAKSRFFTWYGYAKYEPSEVEEAVARTILEKFEEKEEIVLSPKEIAETMETFDRQIFSDAKNEKHKAAKVGRVIKKFNLSSEKKKQTKKGVSYVFRKEMVVKIYESYFGKYSTPPTPEQKDEINIDEIPM